MNNFIEIPVNHRSIYNRKPLYNRGINDSDYQTQPLINGKRYRCPFYKVWTLMFQRCYSEKYIQRNPTYAECEVSSEWWIFSNFKAWMQEQDYIGKELDKDILSFNTKIYSKETCCFIDVGLNRLLNKNKAQRGEYPLGVSWNSKSQKYQAHCRNGKGKTINLGLFDNELDAHKVYCIYKANLFISLANLQANILVKEALILRANNLLIGE